MKEAGSNFVILFQIIYKSKHMKNEKYKPIFLINFHLPASHFQQIYPNFAHFLILKSALIRNFTSLKLIEK